MSPRGTRLSANAFFTAVAACGHYRVHHTLIPPSKPLDDQDLRLDLAMPAMMAEGRAELERSGVTHRGRVTDTFATAFEVLDRPDQEYHGFFGTGRQNECAALSAVRGRAAATVLRVDDWFTITVTDPERVVDAMVACLPNVGPGRQPPLSVDIGTLAGKPVPDDFSQRTWTVSALPDRGERTAESVRRFLAMDRTGGGQLTRARRGPDGRFHTAAHALNYLDIDGDGRYLMRRSASGWLTITPADFHTLTSALRQLPLDRTR